MDGAAVPMMAYKSHKTVHAAKITGVGPMDANGASTLIFGEIGGQRDVDMSWVKKFTPEVGGYFVSYADGYTSFSPAKAFEEGYTRIDFALPGADVGGIARVCHEVNRAYCEALGDHSQPAWEDSPAWQRESAELGVRLHLGNFEAGPEASHESWMAQKLADGWTWGREKNPEKKEHPCLVPFGELPPEQQAKDFIFRAVVHALR